jgi:hypothetical protein
MLLRSAPVALVFITMTAALPGCQDSAVRNAQLPSYSFDYKIQDREATDLIQVFDDGTKTYLQFANPAETPVISDEAGASVPYERVALFAVIAGRHARLTVHSQGAQSLVVAGSASAPPTHAVSLPARPPPSR